ncbi:MAG: hypothetical protein F6J93_25530 [Oscillatoria sp. SIO1A7]|nr:hypothetical protein [Oscillatoria sp. SIO1A7]
MKCSPAVGGSKVLQGLWIRVSRAKDPALVTPCGEKAFKIDTLVDWQG